MEAEEAAAEAEEQRVTGQQVADARINCLGLWKLLCRGYIGMMEKEMETTVYNMDRDSV